MIISIIGSIIDLVMQQEDSEKSPQKRKKESAFIMRKQTKLVAVLSAAALLAIGASMTSFAAGWTQENGIWVYLDRDGDRVTEEWKKSGANYYWLNEDGEMATSELIEDDDDHYYVNADGVRVANQWVSVDNEEDEEVDGKEVDILWYYMGSSGKAYKATGDNTFKTSTIGGKKYFFDSDGRMVSGWTYDGNATYYLGDENQGWAHTGWQYLEIDEDNMVAPDDDYDNDEAWFNFKSTGKARKDTRDYINKAYYTFDENGVMKDDWVSGTPGSATPGKSFYKYDDGNQKSGWVYTFSDKDMEGDEEWFYLVASNKNTAFNSEGAKGANSDEIQKYKEGYNPDGDAKVSAAAKVIKGKTYLFDKDGKMQTGVFMIAAGDEVVREGGSGNLKAGIYYFDKDGASTKGAMATGKTTVTYDGDDYAYYFQGSGQAYTNILKDGSIYDDFGVRVEAEDGNSYSLIEIDDSNRLSEVKIDKTVYDGGTFVVSATGKVKKSGTVTIDGVKYKVEGYFVTKATDKDNSNGPDLGNYAVKHVKGQ